MEHPRVTIYKLFYRLHKHFNENRASRFQIGLLALVFACLWWALGILAGSGLAFFVYFFTPASPTRAWPAAATLVGTILICGIIGTYLAFKTYTQKVSNIEDRDM